MKKIAILTDMYHTKIGGVEGYVRELAILLIANGYEVHEFKALDIQKDDVSDKVDGIIQHDISGGAKLYRKKATKEMNKIVKGDEFDFIIGNSIATKKLFNSDKYIHVQHMDHKFYDFWSSNTWFDFFNYVFLRIGYWKNPLKRDKTAFFNKIENVYGSKAPIYPRVPLKADMSSQVCFSNRENVFWLGRLDSHHKGLVELNKIGQGISNLVIGGSGKDKNKLKNVANSLVGRLSSEQIKQQFSKAKVYIMTSKFEGFPLVLVEAMSAGVPIVMYDTFTSARFFGECEGVFLINRGDTKGFIKKVNEIQSMDKGEWELMSDGIKSWRETNISDSAFKDAWLNILKSL